MKGCSGGGENGLREMERRAIPVSMANLMTFPWVREAVEQGRLRLHGWWFDLEAGALLGHDEDSGEFKVVSAGGE